MQLLTYLSSICSDTDRVLFCPAVGTVKVHITSIFIVVLRTYINKYCVHIFYYLKLAYRWIASCMICTYGILQSSIFLVKELRSSIHVLFWKALELIGSYSSSEVRSDS